ncbi:MAG: ankyrin repeat domain-containing protein [Silicimonas sp.]|nr:ankyrin repeat domain-containing protein [Silicimonas sp.]
MTSIKQLRRDAKSLRKAFEAGDALARQRVEAAGPRDELSGLKHADFLHVIARERGFRSWPRLIFSVEALGMDRAEKRQRMIVALFHGQAWRVEQLLEADPDLAEGDFHLACALYDRAAVEAALRDDAGLAIAVASDRRPIVWLAASRRFQTRPDLEADMLAIAGLLLAHGADVNDGVQWAEGHMLSALYLAIGAGDNMALGRWLLEHGADPNDNESLYHATELGHHEGLKLLLAHGAKPNGTNALLRAMDFDDVAAVRMLLAAGADPDEFDGSDVGGERPWVYPALHQAARRMCSREMVDVLLDGGADPARVHDGMTAYALARAYGNQAVSGALEARGVATALSPVEAALSRVAEGEAVPLDPEALPEAVRHILREMLHIPGRLEHVKQLVEAGLPFDTPDPEGLTPVQVAGWVGLPEVMGYFLSLGPDLTHVNGYGGTLLSTIIHGSENNPTREGRDYEGCLRLALEAGVALPRRAAQFAGDLALAAFLEDWAEAHPEQVVEDGVV